MAIIGGGISGLTCAHLLHPHHDITLFEKAPGVGGHTATIDVEHKGRHYRIDTGFIVYNDRTYPNFIRLMDRLGVESQDTTMGFSVHCEKSGLEYSGGGLNGFFAQRRNLCSVTHWRMLGDILRFNREAKADLEADTLAPEMTLGEYLQSRQYGRDFIEHYLVPMGSAIWSTSEADMLAFPLLFFVRFFSHHGLLTLNNRPQWKVIRGGSAQYLQPLTQPFRDKIVCGRIIQQVRRHEDRVEIYFDDGQCQTFDQVIFACHSDEALALLADASDTEQTLLGAIPYAMNEVVLHTDIGLLPKRKAAWSSWNYLLSSRESKAATVSYNMNILQGIDSEETFVVTLNDTDKIDPQKIIGTYHYAHPQFSRAGMAAQQRWREINGVNRTWFCGAYWRNGFHEDGCWSGVRVAAALGIEAW